ncbi:AcrR family transcriptional regulator [Paenibacillus turicensis]|uniref:AcrR family transcriptional regulator n=1 Tax=Paenibacillus turicensis TaxID=160487 RepID=A0ABS4FQ61_9BACL|nr:TetR family transcriptional regulator C-terminal domain-containing protein [Paenibacillus turicensis]MBP1904706.1 AcrR family transcriptional regulator [Paenibacillus turicensis]
MPKIVDHEKQRQLVADAAIRLIKKGGLEHATVRNIAVEAGLSVGSMRHYFSTQADLFTFCMNIFIKRVQERVRNTDMDNDLFANDPFTGLQAILMEFIPFDEDRKMEMEVWLSFTAKTLVHPGLQAVSEQMYEGIRGVVKFVLEQLTVYKLAKPNLNLALETYKLSALMDGLAVHLITQPGHVTHAMAEQIINEHLRSLCI